MKTVELSLFKPSNQLDFYCQDGYFRAYGEDAMLAAKATGFRCETRDGMPVLSFSLIRQSDIVLPRLVRAGFKIRMIGL
jgi:hypothetical protein